MGVRFSEFDIDRTLGHNLINLRKYEEAIPYFQRAGKYFFMANNLELAGLCYIEEGKAFLKLNKLQQEKCLNFIGTFFNFQRNFDIQKRH